MENHYRHRGVWLRCVMALLCLLFTSLTASAYTDGQHVTFDSINYTVASAASFTLQFNSTDLGGVVNIPDKVNDGEGNVFTVTQAVITGDLKVTELHLPDASTFRWFQIYNKSGDYKIYLSKYVGYIYTGVYFTGDIIIDSDNTFYTQDENLIVYNKAKTNIVYVPSSINFTDSTFVIPEGVASVSSYLSAPGYKRLELPSTLKSLSQVHGRNCAEIIVNDGNKYFYSVDGVLVNRTNNELVAYPPKKRDEKYIIPDEIKGIGSYAFRDGIKYLKDLDLNKVEYLTEQLCPKLRTLTIGESLDTIQDLRLKADAFVIEAGNRSFKLGSHGEVLSNDGTILYGYPAGRGRENYTVPSGVETIKAFAFNMCKSFDTLTIAKTVKTIERFGIYDCAANTLKFEDGSEMENLNLGGITVNEFSIPSDVSSLASLPSSMTHLTIPEGSQITSLPTDMSGLEVLEINGGNITTIAEGALQDSKNLRTVILPASLKKIGRNAFMDCTNLDSLVFADGCQLDTIAEGAFYNTKLKSVQIPSSVTTIEREAFYGCQSLKKVALSANASSISPEAFKRCDNLEEFTVDEDNQTYSAVKGYLCSKDKSELLIFPPAKANEDVTLLPPSITKIGDYAFFDCPNLKSIVIPKKVTKIGQRAFGLCKNLESIAFLCDSIIPSSAINQETNYMSFDDGSVEGMGNAFENVTLSCVRADLAEQYSNDPFYSKFQSGIKTTFETQREDGGTDEYFPLSNDRMMLMKTTNRLQTYVVGDEVKGEDGKVRSVNMIGDYAFEGSKAEEVVLKKNVHYLGAAAFWTDIAHTTSGAKAATRATSASTEVITPESTTIKSVYFCGDKAPSQLATVDYDMDATFNEFAPDQKIYVRKSVVKDFQEALPKYSDQIDYRITDLKISNGYATFSREFDVDLNDLRSGVSNPVTGTPETVDGSYNGITAYFCGDNGVESWHADGEDHYVIHMTPIDENCDRQNYGKGYIPAGTGVLLKLETSDGGKATPDNYYYTIGEYPGEVNVTTRNSVMHGVVDEDTVISHSTTDGTSYWVMQKGYFREVLDGQSIKVPRHKAYLELVEPATASGSKASLSIGIGGSTTDIVSIDAHGNVESATDGTMYNLAGQRLPENVRAHGVVIQNGKKTIKR